MNIKKSNLLRKDLPLVEQIQQTVTAVRSDPGNVKLRVYLAQLCMVTGDWNRAVTQLQAAAQIDSTAIPMAQMYREAIRCEQIREKVFAGEATPQTIGDSLPWFDSLVQALSSRKNSDMAQADELQVTAFDAAPETVFTINDTQQVAWLADADSRLGPICEIIINGQYHWIPFALINSLRLEPPADLRDLLWASGRLVLTSGEQYIIMVPARYPLSYIQHNDQLALGSLTTWNQVGDQTWCGSGQRMWVSDVGEHPFLTIRSIIQIKTA